MAIQDSEHPNYQIQWGSYHCGWKKSCTTLDGRKPANNGANQLSTGAGFLPSTVLLTIIYHYFWW
jgi:hypothetical protein